MRTARTFLMMILMITACDTSRTRSGHTAHDQTPEPTDGSSDDLMLTDNQMMLANVTTQRARKRPVGETIILNGTLRVDEESSEVISSRAAGRIEKLFVKETGRTVQKGEPLYTLYSETLLTLQQEFLLAREQYALLGDTETRYKSFLDAAERKLVLYGLTPGQVGSLARSGAVQPRITFLSPVSGIVTETGADEGQYVSEGQLLYRIEDMSSLWVEADIYPDETALVKRGDTVTVKVSGVESTQAEATVTFLSPEYRANSQITVMRAEIRNEQLDMKPGQQAQVFFTHSSKEAIAVPPDAVIRDATGAHVYVQLAPNTFQPRMVKTGIEGVDYVEITDGLQEGDTIAATGAYLLYSEIILKKGMDPMAGHAH